MDISSLHMALGAMDFAIQSLGNVLKARANVQVEDRTLGDVLDELIGAQALLQHEYVAMRDESERRRLLLCPTCAAMYKDELSVTRR